MAGRTQPPSVNSGHLGLGEGDWARASLLGSMAARADHHMFSFVGDEGTESLQPKSVSGYIGTSTDWSSRLKRRPRC